MKISVLDAFEFAGAQDSAATLRDTLAWARHAEAVGIHRFWIVEHHNVAFEACPAPEVMLAALAAATQRMRVGTGGILLNNASPYKVAEQARTLRALFGDRIDLGVGRSVSGPGPDLALQRLRGQELPDDHAGQIAELAAWLSGAPGAAEGFAGMAIMPDLGPGPDLWVLAGSARTAAVAGRLGLSLACSGFHRPELVPEITRAYRDAFCPAPQGPQEPQILLALMGAVAETEAEAARLFLPMRMTNELRRSTGDFLPLLPSAEAALAFYGGTLPGAHPLSDRFTVTDIASLRAHVARMREDHGVTELLFRPGIAGLAAKLAMTDLLIRGLGDL